VDDDRQFLDSVIAFEVDDFWYFFEILEALEKVGELAAWRQLEGKPGFWLGDLATPAQ
jgi:hypothetical protein